MVQKHFTEHYQSIELSIYIFIYKAIYLSVLQYINLFVQHHISSLSIDTHIFLSFLLD